MKLFSDFCDYRENVVEMWRVCNTVKVHAENIFLVQFFIFKTKFLFFIIILFRSGCPTTVFSRPGKVGQMCFCPNPYCPPNGTQCADVSCALWILTCDGRGALRERHMSYKLSEQFGIKRACPPLQSSVLQPAILVGLKFHIGKSRCWSLKFTPIVNFLFHRRLPFYHTCLGISRTLILHLISGTGEEMLTVSGTCLF